MAMLATVTTCGRAAIAASVKAQPLHLAWGTGLAEWDDLTDDQLPSLVDNTALYNEIGRRVVSVTGFAEPDEAGGIVVPVGVMPDGSIEEARYRQSTEPTPYLYLRVNYDFGDGASAIIRELGIFTNTQLIEGLPLGQTYFKPADIADPGMLLATQILRPRILRNVSIRPTFEFVFPF